MDDNFNSLYSSMVLNGILNYHSVPLSPIEISLNRPIVLNDTEW